MKCLSFKGLFMLTIILTKQLMLRISVKIYLNIVIVILYLFLKKITLKLINEFISFFFFR